MDEARALEALKAVLARPELNPPPPRFDPISALWDAIWNLIVDFLTWLFRPVARVVAGQADLFQIAILAIALLVIGAGVWFIARAVKQNMVAGDAALARAQTQRRERADRLWREAQDLAAAGNLSAAVKALYLSALYSLEEHNLLPIQEGLTNREHAERLLRALPATAPAFAAVVQHYDRLRYGGYAVDRPAFDTLRDLVQRARALEATPAGPVPVAAAA